MQYLVVQYKCTPLSMETLSRSRMDGVRVACTKWTGWHFEALTFAGSALQYTQVASDYR